MNLISCHPRETLYCHIPSIGNGEVAFCSGHSADNIHCCINDLKACLDVCLVKNLRPSLGCVQKAEGEPAFALMAAKLVH